VITDLGVDKMLDISVENEKIRIGKGVSAGSCTINYNYDNIYVLNYTSPEPTFSILSEEDETIQPTISYSCSPTSVNLGQTIICSCSATDNIDSSPTVSYTVNPSTSSTGTFTTTCTATDDAGNSVSSSINYLVLSTGEGNSTYKPTQEQIEKGYKKSLRKNWKISFKFGNETHTIKLDDIINKTAIITVSSELQTFNLTFNQTKKLNLNDDGFYDLQIFLKNITDYKADLIVKLIHEEIPAELLEKEEKEIMEKFQFLLIIILVGIVVIISIIIFIIKGKKNFKKNFKKLKIKERLGISKKKI